MDHERRDCQEHFRSLQNIAARKSAAAAVSPWASDREALRRGAADTQATADRLFARLSREPKPKRGK